MDLGSAPWGMSPPPGEPTPAGPGSERKIEVLIARAARREPLFHPLDGLCCLRRLSLPMAPEAKPPRLESA
jgi:hypothetical protein